MLSNQKKGSRRSWPSTTEAERGEAVWEFLERVYDAGLLAVRWLKRAKHSAFIGENSCRYKNGLNVPQKMLKFFVRLCLLPPAALSAPAQVLQQEYNLLVALGYYRLLNLDSCLSPGESGCVYCNK